MTNSKTKITPEQNKLIREFRRLTRLIEHAEKGKALIRPNVDGYTDSQYEAYKYYCGVIERAFEKIANLKEQYRRVD